jgi:hypothetical protein
MPTIRRILRHVSAETSRGTRLCRRDRSHVISRGEPCLTILNEGTPYNSSYCARCALPILKQCGAELRVIRDLLFGAELGSLPTSQAIPSGDHPERSAGELLVAKNRSAIARKRIPVAAETLPRQPSAIPDGADTGISRHSACSSAPSSDYNTRIARGGKAAQK